MGFVVAMAAEPLTIPRHALQFSASANIVSPHVRMFVVPMLPWNPVSRLTYVVLLCWFPRRDVDATPRESLPLFCGLGIGPA